MTYKNQCISMLDGRCTKCRMEPSVTKADEMLEYVPFGPEKTDGFLWEHTDYKSGSNAVEQ